MLVEGKKGRRFYATPSQTQVLLVVFLVSPIRLVGVVSIIVGIHHVTSVIVNRLILQGKLSVTRGN